MRTSVIVFVSALVLSGCNFSKSVKVDLLTGLSTSGDLLSCEDVFLSVNGHKVNRNAFTYGERLNINFSDVKGMKSENGKVFPDLGMIVLDKSGDTIVQVKDLYSQFPDGIKSSPVDLSVKLTIASPIFSGKDYTLFVKIHDKKDKGSYTAKLNFKVSANQKLNVEANKVSCNEIYLFSKNTGG